MPKNIAFPDREPAYVFDRDCLAFPALLDGKAIQCLVTAELLVARFQARDMTEEAMRQAFRAHKVEIEDIARSHIENVWIDEEGRVFLTTRYTRLTVSFGEPLDEWHEGRAAAEAAQKMLTEMIGPNAGEVIVEWRGDLRSPPMILFRIIDPALPYSVNGFVETRHWGDPSMLSVILAAKWGSILRARSRKLVITSG